MLISFQSINDKLHYHSDSHPSALHIGDVIVTVQDRETVQIQAVAYFYQYEHNNFPDIINVVLKQAIENLLGKMYVIGMYQMMHY